MEKSCLLGARRFGIQASGSQTTGKSLEKRRHSIFREDGTYQKYIIFQRKKWNIFSKSIKSGMDDGTYLKKKNI